MTYQPTPKEEAIQMHSDMYKDVHGIRPRWMAYEDMSVEDIYALCDALETEIQEENAQEREEERFDALSTNMKLHELYGQEPVNPVLSGAIAKALAEKMYG